MKRIAILAILGLSTLALGQTPTSATVTIVVAPAPAKAALTLAVSPNPMVGQPVTVTASVACTAGSPAGSILFTTCPAGQTTCATNPVTITTAALTNGKAVCTETPTTSGSYPLTATLVTTNPNCY